VVLSRLLLPRCFRFLFPSRGRSVHHVASTTSTERRDCSVICCRSSREDRHSRCGSSPLGTGQALRHGPARRRRRRARARQAAREKFLGEGHGVRRFDVMYNDFVLIGPKSDPAGAAGGKDIVQSFSKNNVTANAIRVARRQERHPLR